MIPKLKLVGTSKLRQYLKLKISFCQIDPNSLKSKLKMFNLFKITPKKRTVKIGKKYGILYSNPTKPRRLVFHIGTTIFLIGLVYFGYLYTPLIKSVIVYKFSSKSKFKHCSCPKIPKNVANNLKIF